MAIRYCGKIKIEIKYLAKTPPPIRPSPLGDTGIYTCDVQFPDGGKATTITVRGPRSAGDTDFRAKSAYTNAALMACGLMCEDEQTYNMLVQHGTRTATGRWIISSSPPKSLSKGGVPVQRMQGVPGDGSAHYVTTEHKGYNEGAKTDAIVPFPNGPALMHGASCVPIDLSRPSPPTCTLTPFETGYGLAARRG